MAALSALVSGLDAELRRLGYKDSTMVWYRGLLAPDAEVLRCPRCRGVFPGCGDGVGRRCVRFSSARAGRHPEAE